jgi:hypothetical protein
MQIFRMAHREGNILLIRSRDPVEQPDVTEVAQSHSRNVGVSGARCHRDSHPQALAGGSHAIVGKSIQGNVHRRDGLKVFIVRLPSGPRDTFRTDSSFAEDGFDSPAKLSWDLLDSAEQVMKLQA